MVFGGTLIGIPALHGYGEVAKLMGNVKGYVIRLPQLPVIYLSSDTIYTEDVKNAFQTFKPDISVVAAGSAQLDEYEPILMTLSYIIAFVKDAPGQVIANHMEAANHCTTSRQLLSEALTQSSLLEKTWIPKDGDSKQY